MLDVFKNKIEVLKSKIAPTITDSHQFEINVKNTFISKRLINGLEILDTHFNYIGKDVYRYIKTNTVITKEDLELILKTNPEHELFNPIDKKSILYTKEDYNNFVNWYINFQRTNLIDELIKRSVYYNSTNRFSNLEFQFQIECKQELIKFYDECLDLY